MLSGAAVGGGLIVSVVSAENFRNPADYSGFHGKTVTFSACPPVVFSVFERISEARKPLPPKGFALPVA